jgi:four helix bundle protein
MKYSRFEELPVWNSAIELAVQTYSLAERPAFPRQGGLRDQMQRAAVSISNNIAEGFERGTTQELLTFLYIARGSAGEVRSMLCLLEKLPGGSDLKFEISNLRSLAENVSRQLRGWASKLQDGTIEGQRYLTEKSKRIDRNRRDRSEFIAELRNSRERS